ncbi:GNAT family N-acetyltransferase [Scatolibacter rhodanostii]|uniref:GNAT family N-acetyltransferase n=1 Tax=Scatolibacter rhodanostii TaxID=2014781 RepID=UPI000C075F16|nr:GNAT family N-acetyltransferase [Scatolibacter rhodanostii]
MIGYCLRQYKAEDDAEMVKLFQETVHSVNAKDYTKEQQDVWAPKEIELKTWCKAFKESYTVIAESEGKMVGFANLDGNYFDRLFVHKDFQRLGIGAMLAEDIESQAVKKELTYIDVQASITAKPFFERCGYKVIKKQRFKRNNIFMENFVMKKSLRKC